MTDHGFAVLGEVDALGAALDWYRDVSGGGAHLAPTVLGGRPPEGGWTAYAGRGGTGPAPSNSQGLVVDLLAGVDRGAVARAGGAVLVGAPPEAGFAPHAWRLRGGGVWLGGRAWARRYAVVPADAPLGTVVHELGHLLFGWLDHDRRSGLGADCVMATGAAAAEPAPPCAPTRVEAGWAAPVRGARTTRVADLADGTVLTVRDRLVSRGPTGDVLVFDGRDLVGRVRAQADRPVLAVVAALL